MNPPLLPFSFIHSSELSSGLLYLSSRNKLAINPLALTYGEVFIAQGRQPSLVVVQEVLGLWHHTVAPQEQIGEDCVDHPKSEDTNTKVDDHVIKVQVELIVCKVSFATEIKCVKSKHFLGFINVKLSSAKIKYFTSQTFQSSGWRPWCETRENAPEGNSTETNKYVRLYKTSIQNI